MTNQEAIKILKEEKERNKFTLEKGCDMMSAGVVSYVTDLIRSLDSAIEILEKAPND
jgi:uncharacterized protein YbcV (DUF1398 family)